MATDLFKADGHLHWWIFYPEAWCGSRPWAESFQGEEKHRILEHLALCPDCRSAESAATRKWEASRALVIREELIPIEPFLPG